MAKATGLIFSPSDVVFAQEMPFGTPQYVQCTIHSPVHSFVFHSSLLTTKSVNLAASYVIAYFCNGLFVLFIVATS